MIPNLEVPKLVLPKGFTRQREAILKWFRETDEKLCNFVEQGALRVETAQDYFRFKVTTNPHLSNDDKQRLSNESKVWKMPV